MQNASKRFDNEFAVHLNSSASMGIFDQNTFASFRNFFEDEIHMSRDWRVALSEIIFPYKIEHIAHEILTSYSLSGLEDNQMNSSEANDITRIYNGERLGLLLVSKASLMDEEHTLVINWTQLKINWCKRWYQGFLSDFPTDLSVGKFLIFNYTNITGYHYVGDAKAPLLRTKVEKQ